MDLSIAGEQTDGCLPTHRTLSGRALWWMSAVLLAGMIAIVLPIGQIRMLGAQLGGIIGSYGSGGHYDVTYTGGDWAYSRDTTGKNSGHDINGSAYPVGGGTNCSASCTGKITATFTWDAGVDKEPPPDSVIVTEVSSLEAQAYAQSGSQAVVKADDGLGDPPTTNSTNDLISSGSRYSVVSSPGASFTVSATPNGSATVTGGVIAAAAPPASSSSTAGGVSCRLGYSATATPVRIIISGTTIINGKQSILIGQEASVSLSLDILAKVSNWTWTIDGDPFKGFDPTNPVMGGPANGQPMTGKAMELANPLNESSPSYFYRSIFTKGASPGFIELSMAQKVTCTATVTFPDKLTAQVKAENTVNVYQPAHTMVATAGMVSDYINRTVYLVSRRPADPANPADKGSETGSNWAGTVSTPAGFRILQDCGTWGYAQIVSHPRFFKKEGMQNMVGFDRVDIWDPNIHQITLIEKDNPGPDDFGLDVSFPYGGVSFFSANGSPGDAPGTIAGTGIGDNPGFAIGPAIKYASIDFSATSYMLYKPPSAGGRVTFVPLHYVKWSASGFHDFLAKIRGDNAVKIEGNSSTSTLPDWDRVESPLPLVNQ